MIWMKQEVLKDMRYCFDQYYRYYEDCDSLEDFKVKEWDRINSSNEEREKFIAFYIDDYINNNDKQYFELLSERFEYDNNFMWFLGKDIFTDWDKVWDELSSR